MRRLSYVAFVAIFALVLVASKGARTSTGVVILIFALLAAIALYFGTRDRSKPPTVAERSLATTWLWLRRTL
jgi:hypothetical protein